MEFDVKQMQPGDKATAAGIIRCIEILKAVLEDE